ncbi:hypothetical protein BGZ96_001711 [Linnemannia gamsii]|uniref:F-box domain-containing protein n=1 Tax=Linnemannia gamsii TaxID=64522 RepID=A0ABQ7JM30_9FUNG|nr:hypothetical protein BGZ96_001711 [Linnemannia gamsii]
MYKATFSSLPPECISLVGLYLDRSDLYNCVTLNKDWLCFFTPHLWRHVQIHCPREPSRRTFLTEPTLEQRDEWFQRLKRSTEAGGLDRNGHYVHTFDCEHYEAVELLAARGEACRGIRVLKLGSYPDPDSSLLKLRKFAYVPPLDLLPLIRILKRNVRLRHLRLVGRMLDERNYDFYQLLEDIPGSILCLELKDWNPIKGNRKYDRDLRAKEYESGAISDLDLEERDVQGETRFPLLKELGFCDYAFDFNERTTYYILKNTPNLETLCLRDTYQPIPLKPVSRLLARYCPRIMHLHLRHWLDCLDDELAELLDSSKAGWRTLDLPATRSIKDEDEFGPLSTAAIMKHGSTLETLRLDYSQKFSNLIARGPFRMAGVR